MHVERGQGAYACLLFRLKNSRLALLQSGQKISLSPAKSSAFFATIAA
jgi:hypothetical protein